MIKVIKYGCEYNIDKKSLATINVTYDGLQILLNDQTEIRFSFQVTNQLKALIPILKMCPSENITLNLDNVINGNYDKVLILNNEEPKVQPQVIVCTPVEEEKPKATVEKPKNKGGRPRKSTVKKS